eukprot:gb/GEZJ01005029.1/.p1 GENE.gb/GEZJ01005029.1/~~gb/GEZJ01005029.1/.p1  ORF type:complete len:114 (-),score=13.23 gb/GEZJ01005029.1/:136-477(-)
MTFCCTPLESLSTLERRALLHPQVQVIQTSKALYSIPHQNAFRLITPHLPTCFAVLMITQVATATPFLYFTTEAPSAHIFPFLHYLATLSGTQFQSATFHRIPLNHITFLCFS